VLLIILRVTQRVRDSPAPRGGTAPIIYGLMRLLVGACTVRRSAIYVPVEVVTIVRGGHVFGDDAWRHGQPAPLSHPAHPKRHAKPRPQRGSGPSPAATRTGPDLHAGETIPRCNG
jgi:hypothetical protein